MQSIVIDKEKLTLEDVVAIARQGVRVDASSQGEQRVEKARELISKWVKEKKVIYGITTGFRRVVQRSHFRIRHPHIAE